MVVKRNNSGAETQMPRQKDSKCTVMIYSVSILMEL